MDALYYISVPYRLLVNIVYLIVHPFLLFDYMFCFYCLPKVILIKKTILTLNFNNNVKCNHQQISKYPF